VPRMKKPENESPEDAKIRQQKEFIANTSTRSEKTAWNRKYNNITKLIDGELSAIEDEYLVLFFKREKALDKVAKLRSAMVDECVHPFDQLIHKTTFVECKFCNRKIGISSAGE